MLDGLLGRNFSSKCKSSIKGIKTRIDVIRRKRNATQKFLKKDIADLLANGLDINAYGRAEGLMAELILSSCYDFIEQSCDCVVKHLSTMQKQSECPEECRTGVASLMFAAARFSDLPELRDLRHVFQEKYGNSLEYFVNQKFIENLASQTSTMEKKIQLMQDIASELSIRWDSKAFERTMTNPSASMQGQPQKYTEGRFKSPNGSNTVLKGDKNEILSKERHEHSSKGHISQSRREERHEHSINGHPSQSRREDNASKRDEFNHQFYGREDVYGNGQRSPYGIEKTIQKRDRHDIPFQERQEILDKHEKLAVKEAKTPKAHRSGNSSPGKRVESNDGGRKLPNVREQTIREKDGHDASSHGKQEFALGCEGLMDEGVGKEIPFMGDNHSVKDNTAKSSLKVKAEEMNGLKPYNKVIPPPYVKPPKASRRVANLETKDAGFGCAGPGEASADPSGPNKISAGDKSDKIQLGSDHPDYEMQLVEPVRVNNHHHDKDQKHQVENIGDLMPKPRSVRRRHSKSSLASHDDNGFTEDRRVAKRSSSGRRRGGSDSRRGLQLLFNDEHKQRDEEERMIDKLLLHYSKKPSSNDPEKLRRKSKAHPSHLTAADGGDFSQNASRDEPDGRSETVATPARSVSLPHEQTASSEAAKVFSRAASFQPDRSNPARHVHPKLPDYDELAAQFAALKG